jgi:cell division protein FtsL
MAAQAFPVQYERKDMKDMRSTKAKRTLTVVEHNRELFEAQMSRRRGPTLEIPFPKHIDNTRLVKSSDRRRVREMRSFALATIFLFSLLAVYVFQHFNAIENGYRVEAQKQQVDSLLEANRHLRLEQAQLTDPSRIDDEAKQLGMTPPQPGQVVQQDGVDAAQDSPVLAQANEPKLAK